MTIRAEIIGSDCAPAGWVEVDPFDYHYTGADPDGAVETYLSDVQDGTRTFDWPEEDDEHYGTEYAPDLKLLTLANDLRWLDPIWYVDLPADFETTTITYGETSNSTRDEEVTLIECPECNGRNTRDEYVADSEHPEMGQHVRCPCCSAAVHVTRLIEVSQ